MIDPRRSADQDSEYQIRMQASLLPRLIAAVSHIDEEVAVDLHFFRDEQGRVCLKGEASANAGMRCQRCMKVSEQRLLASIDLIIVHTDEQAKSLPKELDAWVVEDSANLHELIEDELLLAMPIVAYHPDADCKVPDKYISQEPLDGSKRPSPFAVLKDLTGKSG